MANTERRMMDRDDKQFIPMNVEGNNYTDKTISTPKLLTLVGIICTLGFIMMYLEANNMSLRAHIFFIGVWVIASSYAVRYVIFEERLYYGVYKKRKGNEVTTPQICWNIASIKDTPDGAIMTYADAKIGLIVKVDRDTVTGKEASFEEHHFDCLSDFYKYLVKRNLNYVHLNIMEKAGKDARLNELDSLCSNCANGAVKGLLEKQVGFIKVIAQNSLYESDYWLIWTSDITRIDSIIKDTIEGVLILMNGAYTSYNILSNKELIELDKEDLGIGYFNATEASLNIYKDDIQSRIPPFNLHSIVWTDGSVRELNKQDIFRVQNITSCIIEETLNIEDVSLKEALPVVKDKKKKGVEFDKLSKNVNVTKYKQDNTLSSPDMEFTDEQIINLD